MTRKMIDPRAPRVNAAITSFFALSALSALIYDQHMVGLSILAYTTFIFIWSVMFPKITHPYSVFFERLVRPKLSQLDILEDARAPFFAQKIGLLISGMAFVSALFNPLLGAVFAAILFVASALNAYLNICLGCILYLRLRKFGITI